MIFFQHKTSPLLLTEGVSNHSRLSMIALETKKQQWKKNNKDKGKDWFKSKQLKTSECADVMNQLPDGKSDLDNLKFACDSCHRKLTQKT